MPVPGSGDATLLGSLPAMSSERNAVLMNTATNILFATEMVCPLSVVCRSKMAMPGARGAAAVSERGARLAGARRTRQERLQHHVDENDGGGDGKRQRIRNQVGLHPGLAEIAFAIDHVAEPAKK